MPSVNETMELSEVVDVKVNGLRPGPNPLFGVVVWHCDVCGKIQGLQPMGKPKPKLDVCHREATPLDGPTVQVKKVKSELFAVAGRAPSSEE